jgi:hypothetical protein
MDGHPKKSGKYGKVDIALGGKDVYHTNKAFTLSA